LERRREPLPTRVQDTPPLPATYHKALDDGLASLGLDLTPDARGVVDGHARLLLAWTAAINLTAIREPRAVAVGHVVDSLTSVPAITARRPRRLLDLGSGGGYPGIPVAAILGTAEPGTEMTLLEPIGKKARFLATVVDATALTGRAHVDRRRAEALGRDGSGVRWDMVLARAVATTADLVELAFPVLAPGGSLVAWKRGDLASELSGARRAVDALGGGDVEVIDVGLKGLDGHRLVVATRAPGGSIPDRFPRDPAQRTRAPW
jgi:16S rRNA (guanine527-N7)-methyltransferase